MKDNSNNPTVETGVLSPAREAIKLTPDEAFYVPRNQTLIVNADYILLKQNSLEISVPVTVDTLGSIRELEINNHKFYSSPSVDDTKRTVFETLLCVLQTERKLTKIRGKNSAEFQKGFDSAIQTVVNVANSYGISLHFSVEEEK